MLSNEEMRTRIRGNEIAVIFQDPMESLNPVFTVGGQLREFIELNRDLAKREAKREAIRMLREVGIPDPEQRYEEYPTSSPAGCASACSSRWHSPVNPASSSPTSRRQP